MSETSQNWKSLYKIGGIASMIYLIYSLVTMVPLMTIGGQPARPQEGFTMLAENRLGGRGHLQPGVGARPDHTFSPRRWCCTGVCCRTAVSGMASAVGARLF